MSQLYHYTHAAERDRGCVWADGFESLERTVLNGGVITGAPPFDRDTGVTLSGGGQNIEYAIQPHLLYSDEISLVYVFNTDIDPDDNVNYNLFDADTAGGTGRINVLKRNGAGTNNLKITLGGTALPQIPFATYAPYWVIGGRNVLGISGTSGNTSVWLNGHVILAAAATAWTPEAVENIYVGISRGGTSAFVGSITSFKIFNSLLTDEEMQAYTDNSMWTYRDRALIDLPMRAADHDAANGLTINRGRLGRAGDAVFGAGVAEPTKLTDSRGYEFDGGDFLQILHAAGFTFTTAMTIGAMVVADDTAANRYIADKRDGANNGFNLLNTGTNFRFIVDSGSATNCDGTTIPVPGHLYRVIATYDGSASHIYVNRLLEGSAAPSGDISNAVDLYFGSSSGTGNFWDGSIRQGFFAQFALNPMQVMDLDRKMLLGVNRL